MKKITSYFLFSILLLTLLNGCSSTNDQSESVFQYKGSMIGDNSAVINIIGQLQYAEKFEEVSLETKAEPYGMTVTYENMDTGMVESDYEETAVHNASYLFALIDNAEWVAFDFDDDQYTINKADLEDWYGKELDDFTTEEELEVFIQEKLQEDNDLQELFAE